MQNILRLTTAGALSSLALPAACATPTGAKPDDMSASEHRATAHDLDEHAQRKAARYNPNADAASNDVGVLGTGNLGPDNPTAHYKYEANRLRTHAQAHREAAADLESFEARACESLPGASRRLCPLSSGIVRAEVISDGVRFLLGPDAPTDEILARMRCHYAFGRTQGRKHMPGCPLYLRGLEFAPAADGRSIDVTAEDTEVVQQLRTRAAAHN